jgi:hypothetical protein
MLRFSTSGVIGFILITLPGFETRGNEWDAGTNPSEILLPAKPRPAMPAYLMKFLLLFFISDVIIGSLI